MKSFSEYVRGGIFINVVDEHRKPGWMPAPFEACPCGSGKKFKKCCGAPPTLH